MKPLYCMIRRRSDGCFSDGQTPDPKFVGFNDGRVWSHSKYAKNHCQGLADPSVYADCDVVSFGDDNVERGFQPFGADALEVWERKQAKIRQQKKFKEQIGSFTSSYVQKGRRKP